jgi:hypothetical protein
MEANEERAWRSHGTMQVTESRFASHHWTFAQEIQMTKDDKKQFSERPELGTEKEPPFAGTVAGRVPAPAVAEDDEPASPGAEADKQNLKD